MRKNSSDFSKGAKSGPPGSFRKSDSAKPFGKSALPAKKSFGDDKPSGKRSFGDDKPAGKKTFGDKPFGKRRDDNTADSRSSEDNPFARKRAGDKPYARKSAGDKPYARKSAGDDKPSDRPFARKTAGDKPYARKSAGDDKSTDRKSFGDRPYAKKSYGDDKPSDRRAPGEDKPYARKSTGDKPFARKSQDDDNPSDRRTAGEDRPYARKSTGDKPYAKKSYGDDKGPEKKTFGDKPYAKKPGRPEKTDDEGSLFREVGKPARAPRNTEDRPEKQDDGGFFREVDPSAPGERAARPDRKFDRPAKGKVREAGEEGSERKERKSGKPAAFGRDKNTTGEERGAKFTDSRPFRDRPKAAAFDKDKKAPAKGGKKGKEEKGPRTFTDVVNNAFNEPAGKKPVDGEEHPGKREQFEDKVYGALEDADDSSKLKKPYELKKKSVAKAKPVVEEKPSRRKKKYKEEEEDEEDAADAGSSEMTLNKYIAHSGECSRRDAAEFVKLGKVKVNGELVLDPGYRVQPDDKISMSGKKLTPQKGMVYILLNKPKGFITTNDDPQGRKTVMELVASAGIDRLFPVGRLDRDTSGLLLITNDGDLTQKLCHPSYKIKKVYHVTLDKLLTKADFEKIVEGVTLDDGKADVDALAFLDKKNELGLEIHSGRNRIVRRIFESLGYVVEKLDRVMYAGLTKKNLPRSKWRFLDEREIVLLKHFKS